MLNLVFRLAGSDILAIYTQLYLQISAVKLNKSQKK